MKVTYWSDYACPYCYIGETRLGKAIASLGLEGEVEVEMRAFELNPDAPYEVVATTLNTNMLDAHRLTKLAHSLGNTRFEGLCYEAYFVKNEVMADHGVLRKLAAEAGLPEADVERVLASDEYKDEVRADERDAYAMGVHAVTFFVVDGTYAISGCYPTEEMARVLERAHGESLAEGAAQGMACGPEGCSF